MSGRNDSEDVNVDVTTEVVEKTIEEVQAWAEADNAAENLSTTENAEKAKTEEKQKEEADQEKADQEKKKKADDKIAKKAKQEAKADEKKAKKTVTIKFNIEVAYGKKKYKKDEITELIQSDLDCLGKDWYTIQK